MSSGVYAFPSHARPSGCFEINKFYNSLQKQAIHIASDALQLLKFCSVFRQSRNRTNRGAQSGVNLANALKFPREANRKINSATRNYCSIALFN